MLIIVQYKYNRISNSLTHQIKKKKNKKALQNRVHCFRIGCKCVNKLIILKPF